MHKLLVPQKDQIVQKVEKIHFTKRLFTNYVR